MMTVFSKICVGIFQLLLLVVWYLLREQRNDTFCFIWIGYNYIVIIFDSYGIELCYAFYLDIDLVPKINNIAFECLIFQIHFKKFPLDIFEGFQKLFSKSIFKHSHFSCSSIWLISPTLLSCSIVRIFNSLTLQYFPDTKQLIFFTKYSLCWFHLKWESIIIPRYFFSKYFNSEVSLDK